MRNGLVHVIAGLLVVVMVCVVGGGVDCLAAVARQDDVSKLLCDASERQLWFVIPAGENPAGAAAPASSPTSPSPTPPSSTPPSSTPPSSTPPATTSSSRKSSSSGGWQLCHHAFDMPGEFYLPQATLPQRPVAIACWGDQVWMVLETGREGAVRREVFTISVVKDVALGRYHSEPRDRLDLAPLLPSDGALTSFVGAAEGPVAVIVGDVAGARAGEAAGEPRDGASVGEDDSGDGEKQAEKAVAPLSILQLRNNRWVEIAPPADLPAIAGNRALVGNCGADASTLNLLMQTHENQTLRYQRIDGEWVRAEVSSPLAWENLMSITHIAGQIGAVISHADSNQIQISAIRTNGLLPLASFTPPEGNWGVAGTKDAIYLVNRTASGSTQLRTIHPLTGKLSEPQTLAVQPISARRIWQSSLLLAAALIGILLMFLIKPPAKDAVKLPKGIAVLPPMSRLLAFALDVAPAAGLVVFAMGKSLNEVLAMPIATLNFAQSGAYLMTLGIVWGHTALSEIVFGRSLGKALLDVRIVRLDGQKPRLMQMVARNLIKPLIFLVPPLGVLALFNHHLQGLHDLVAGTLVVHEEAKENQ